MLGQAAPVLLTEGTAFTFAAPLGVQFHLPQPVALLWEPLVEDV